MSTKYVAAVFEAGQLRPLEPLNLREHERVEVAIVRAGQIREESDDDYLPNIAAQANAAISLEQVQQALAKIPGSLVADFARERDERF